VILSARERAMPTRGRWTRQAIVPMHVAPADPQMALDGPAAGTYAQPVVLQGWAIDLGASTGTGVDQVTVTAYPSTGGAIALGTASYGIARSDVAQEYGSQFEPSGYALTIRGLVEGTYELVVAARSTVTGTVNQTRA
jgi:hypothetical protein